MKFTIKIPSIDENLYVYIGEDEKKGFLKTYNIESRSECGISVNNAIWVDELNLSILIHELHHAVTFITNNKGIDDEEFEAYLQEYLFIEICKKCENKYDRFKLYGDAK